MIHQVRQQHPKFKGLEKLLHVFNRTPMAVLHDQAAIRKLKVEYRLEELRPATSQSGEVYVMAVMLTGVFPDSPATQGVSHNKAF